MRSWGGSGMHLMLNSLNRMAPSSVVMVWHVSRAVNMVCSIKRLVDMLTSASPWISWRALRKVLGLKVMANLTSWKRPIGWGHWDGMSFQGWLAQGWSLFCVVSFKETMVMLEQLAFLWLCSWAIPPGYFNLKQWLQITTFLGCIKHKSVSCCQIDCTIALSYLPCLPSSVSVVWLMSHCHIFTNSFCGLSTFLLLPTSGLYLQE